MINPRFIHLNLHSDYSITKGLPKINSIIKKLVELNMPAVALTDFTNLFGVIKFYKLAYHFGIKSIIGAEFSLNNDIFNIQPTKLTILAINKVGYHNLIMLISYAYQYGYTIKGPTINRDWLIKFKSGLIILSGGRKGDLGKALLSNNLQLLDKYLLFYKKYFFEHYYLELIRTNRKNEEKYLQMALEISASENIPVVATNDVCFLNMEDFSIHEIRIAINYGYTINDKRKSNFSCQQYLRNEKEMCKLFSDIPTALENSVEIAKRCNVIMQFNEYFLPKFIDQTVTEKELLINKSRAGLENILKVLFPNANIRSRQRLKYDQRLKKELNVINQMGFPGYFLIVMEFIQWAKENGIPVGPGRGSGAGSLVAYVLKITDIDPLKFDLIFERFLNPDRISMPDFDIDFCMDKRDKVIDHVAHVYGRDSVSQIITFGTMTAKAVIRDVGRALGYPYGFVNNISKLIPSDLGITLKKIFSTDSKISQIYERDEEIKVLIDIARKLEGVTRNASKHAGGLVISPSKITDFTPLYRDENHKNTVTQFDKNDIEHIGLVKFDFLGLRTLTIIQNALDMINLRLKKSNSDKINILDISLNDKKSFDLLKSTKTIAVFQLESTGIRKLIKRLQPDCFEDIIALLALFRPGPLQSGMVDNFINRKRGYEKIAYPDIRWEHKILKPILAPTYGIILYQEQVMQIAQSFAGYTLGSADLLRRAMGKKKPEEMEQHRSIFKNGAKKKGIDTILAMKIFDLVEKFAGYGFNKSHSVAYAFLSYQTLWLKANYPAEFMAAVINADIDNTEKIVRLIDECKNIGIKILPPNINISMYFFHAKKNNEIFYGMGAIKGIGKSVIETILNIRKKQSFQDIFDFCQRIDQKKITNKIIEKLIKSGCMDTLGLHRAALISVYPHALKAAYQNAKRQEVKQVDLFDFISPDKFQQIKGFYSNVALWSDETRLKGEHETLGLYITGHPFTQYIQEINTYINHIPLKDINASFIRSTKNIVVVGLVKSIRFLETKFGKRISILILDDYSAHLEVVVFSKNLEKYQKFLEKNKILVIQGKIDFDTYNNIKMKAYEIVDIEKARERYIKSISINCSTKKINAYILNQFYHIIKPYNIGSVPIKFFYKKNNMKQEFFLKNIFNVVPSNLLIDDLRLLFGHTKIEFTFNPKGQL
ncbi:DNA polymerase III subunit alpha [Candidatus Tachikawaea gelatinosa]|uniref:DNA polymerase III subunit alpha n=1 Tax=Candidatus Tachikawaea gelatinosa TaxID=1410383 RepID=A0A090BWD3_9ENTR|nr:DNA polymerase III subunit alpha [Candidatus Tachikawaea gelatinosa]BAP58406.1 DNA polymerase III alpha subunit [Candidatus Tachikawaea gelatinosa]